MLPKIVLFAGVHGIHSVHILHELFKNQPMIGAAVIVAFILYLIYRTLNR
ncbi:hypothetical protein OXT66_00145 [Lentilactobacillus senioris]|nr:hypothetical protein [Lentilactobacillus senioris]MCY9805955.1 hypothetical protein [Lentilactobacillus senioris]